MKWYIFVVTHSHRRSICCYETINVGFRHLPSCIRGDVVHKKMYVCVYTRKSRMSLPVVV